MSTTQTKTNVPGRLGIVQKLMSEHVNPFSGAGIGKQLGFSDRYFDAMFAVAANYYDNNRLDDAIKIAYQLILLQSSEPRNYKLMGACLQAKEDYVAAIKVYENSILLAMLDAEIYFYLGQCQFLTKAFSDAVKSLSFAKNLCEEDSSAWEHIAQHVNELLARAQSCAPQA